MKGQLLLTAIGPECHRAHPDVLRHKRRVTLIQRYECRYGQNEQWDTRAHLAMVTSDMESSILSDSENPLFPLIATFN